MLANEFYVLYNANENDLHIIQGGFYMKNKKINRLMNSIVLVLVLVMVSGCGSKVENEEIFENGKITVYTSFYAMHDFANKIGGDKINLINLVPTGMEPHDWEPSPNDIVKLEKADVFIYNGAGMEHWVGKVLESVDSERLVVVETAKGLKLLEGIDDHEEDLKEKDDEELKYDPHVWLNPMLAKQQMEAIKEAFVLADPSNKEFYENNYTDYAEELDELFEEFTSTLSAFEHRDIIVAHQAYGYLCDAFDLNQIPIEGLNADAEPSPSRMAEIIEFAKEKDIKVIFFEEMVSPKVAETIAEEIGAQTAVLSPLEGLKEADIAAGKEYFSVMRENLEALKQALR